MSRAAYTATMTSKASPQNQIKAKYGPPFKSTTVNERKRSGRKQILMWSVARLHSACFEIRGSLGTQMRGGTKKKGSGYRFFCWHENDEMIDGFENDWQLKYLQRRFNPTRAGGVGRYLCYCTNLQRMRNCIHKQLLRHQSRKNLQQDCIMQCTHHSYPSTGSSSGTNLKI